MSSPTSSQKKTNSTPQPREDDNEELTMFSLSKEMALSQKRRMTENEPPSPRKEKKYREQVNVQN